MEKELLEKIERLNFLLGAIESHTALFIRLYAEQCGKEVEWFNPTVESPIFDKKHGDSAKVEKVKIYVPLEARKD